MLLVSAKFHYLSTIPSCMSAVGEETSEKQAVTFDEIFIATPHQVT